MRAAVVLLTISSLYGQSRKFEVVSIRRCDPKSLHGGVSGSPGRVTVPCAAVKNLIDWTYGAYANGPHFDAQLTLPIEGAPAWMDSERYTINAKAAGSPGILEMFTGPLMQALLADRFKLKFHRETREAPVYALGVSTGKGAPKLQPFKEGSCIDSEDPWGHPLTPSVSSPIPGQPRPKNCRQLVHADNGLDVYGTTMKEFCAVFKNALDRPVIDKTGIAGVFSLHLDLYSTDLGVPGEVVANATGTRQNDRRILDDPADRFDAVRTALRKIGLDLQATKGPQDVIVIDHLERPSEN